MSRIARLVVPHYPHHVTQRGARKQQTFFCDYDFAMYLDLMAKGCKRTGVEIWAYCLMPNHVHLIAVPDQTDGLARLFHNAHRAYTSAINTREGWQGHLWQERFHSSVMDENYLLAAARYTELNPVRAGICKSPADWPWSSYSAHVRGEDDELVTVRPLLRRAPDWRRFVRSQDLDEDRFNVLRKQCRNGRPAGNDGFLEELERKTGRCLRKKKGGRPRKKTS